MPLWGEGVYQQSFKCDGMGANDVFQSYFAKFQKWISSNRGKLPKRRLPLFIVEGFY